MIEVLEFALENTRLIKIICEINEEEKILFVGKDYAEKFFVDRYKANGITTINVKDFMERTDVKYKIEEEHKIELITSLFEKDG